MKDKNRQQQNYCLIKGRITQVDTMEAQDGEKDVILMVEAEHPETGAVSIPCMMRKKLLPENCRTFRKGEWVSLAGFLIVLPDREGKSLGSWVEVIQIEKIPAGKKRMTMNLAGIRGCVTESGCLIDSGKPVRAGFILETGCFWMEEPFALECFVPEEAVEDYIRTLGAEEVIVFGWLEFLLPEETGEPGVSCRLYVHRISPVNCCGKEEAGDR